MTRRLNVTMSYVIDIIKNELFNYHILNLPLNNNVKL